MTSLTEALGPRLIARIKLMPLPRRIQLRETLKAELVDLFPRTPEPAGSNMMATFARTATEEHGLRLNRQPPNKKAGE